MKLKTSVILLSIAILLVLFSFVGVVVLQLQTSGDNLFKENVLAPMPKSVVILDSYNNGWDGVVWLHFKISPSDFSLLLKSKKWEVHPDFLIGADGDGNEEVKNWWKAQSLGDNAIKYYVVIDYEGHERIENIWVNAQRNEVYYKVTSIW